MGPSRPSRSRGDRPPAAELWARLPNPDPRTRFEQARVLALLAGLGQDAKSGVTAAEAAAISSSDVSRSRTA
jgi:hypothetical protein